MNIIMKNILKLTLLSLFMLISVIAFSQREGLTMRILSVDEVEQQPSFQGGDLIKFGDWAKSEFKIPGTVVKNGIQGNIVLSCMIDMEGQIVAPEVIKGLEPSLDNELVRVFSSSPKWEPGKDKGIPVNVNYTFMMSFKFGEDTTAKNELSYRVLKAPRFQGNDPNSFGLWVMSRLQYPEEAKKRGIQGTVFVQFAVDTDGSVVDVNVLKGIDSLLDKEAIRVVSSSPKWEPGMQYDSPVKVRYRFPINFHANKMENQNNDVALITNEIPYDAVELQPTFRGKDAKQFVKWVNSKIKYPEGAVKQGIEGRVIVNFVIDTDGSVVDVNVLNRVDSLLAEEAVRVVSSSPKWEPGMQQGKHVKVSCTFPVEFRLKGKERKIVPSLPEIEVLPTFKKEDPYTRFAQYVHWNTRYPMKDLMVRSVVPFKKSGALVLVGFVVSKDGSVEDVKVIKSSGKEAYDKAAVNVIKKSPKWGPGMDKGVPVDVEYSIIIQFSNGYAYATFI